MELFWKILAIIVIIGFISKQYAPDLYDQSFAKITNYGKELWAGLNSKTDTSLKQDIILPDGSIVSPKSGTILGLPYDTFPCTKHAHCYRFSVLAKCNNLTGECFLP